MQPLQSAPTASGFEEIAVAQQRLLRALADIGQPGLSSPADPDTTAAGIPFSTRPQGLGAVGPLQQARPKADRRSRTRGRAREGERTRAWQPAEGNNVDNGHGGWGISRVDVPLSASSIGLKSTPARSRASSVRNNSGARPQRSLIVTNGGNSAGLISGLRTPVEMWSDQDGHSKPSRRKRLFPNRGRPAHVAQSDKPLGLSMKLSTEQDGTGWTLPEKNELKEEKTPWNLVEDTERELRERIHNWLQGTKNAETRKEEVDRMLPSGAAVERRAMIRGEEVPDTMVRSFLSDRLGC